MTERDTAIPWILQHDTDLIALVTPAGKSLTCLSQLACDAASQSGLTELSLVDHDLKPLKDRNLLVMFVIITT